MDAIAFGKIKEGDEVTVRTKVREVLPSAVGDGGGGRVLTLSEHGASGYYEQDEIVGHVPKPHVFVKNDVVRVRGDASQGLYAVVGVVDGRAWLRGSNGAVRDRIEDETDLVLEQKAPK